MSLSYLERDFETTCRKMRLTAHYQSHDEIHPDIYHLDNRLINEWVRCKTVFAMNFTKPYSMFHPAFCRSPLSEIQKRNFNYILSPKTVFEKKTPQPTKKKVHKCSLFAFFPPAKSNFHPLFFKKKKLNQLKDSFSYKKIPAFFWVPLNAESVFSLSFLNCFFKVDFLASVSSARKPGKNGHRCFSCRVSCSCSVGVNRSVEILLMVQKSG